MLSGVKGGPNALRWHKWLFTTFPYGFHAKRLNADPVVWLDGHPEYDVWIGHIEQVSMRGMDPVFQWVIPWVKGFSWVFTDIQQDDGGATVEVHQEGSADNPQVWRLTPLTQADEIAALEERDRGAGLDG